MTEDQIISISKYNKLKKSTSKKVTISAQNISVFYSGKMAIDNIMFQFNVVLHDNLVLHNDQ